MWKYVFSNIFWRTKVKRSPSAAASMLWKPVRATTAVNERSEWGAGGGVVGLPDSCLLFARDPNEYQPCWQSSQPRRASGGRHGDPELLGWAERSEARSKSEGSSWRGGEAVVPALVVYILNGQFLIQVNWQLLACVPLKLHPTVSSFHLSICFRQ